MKCSDCEYENGCFKPLKMAQYLVEGTCKQSRKRREYATTGSNNKVEAL